LELDLPTVLTLAGAVPASALVTGLVEILKKLVPPIGTKHLESQVAAIFAAGLVVLGMTTYDFSAGAEGLAAAVFVAVTAWYGIMRLSMAIHDDVTQRADSLAGPPGATG